MKTTIFSLIAAAGLALCSMSFAAGAKDYQVTGPVLEVTDTMIAVEANKKDRWEINKDANTKGAADVKVGDKVTVHYTMTAKDVENKGSAKADKSAKKEKAKKDEKKEEKKKE